MRKFVINVNGKSYEVEVEEVGEGKASSPQAQTPVEAAPVKTEAAAPKQAKGAVGAIKITAPMPGNLWEVKVNPGDKVTKGQVVVVLEAMKMENEIMAPQDGTIVSIPVAKGATINSGDVLATME